MNNLFILAFKHFIEIIPFFVLTLLLSAFLAAIIPDNFFERIFKSSNPATVILSSITASITPICTCGMIPLANKLKKKGISEKVVIAFLTTGSSCNISALVLTSVLGIKITLYRFLFSVLLGFITAYFFTWFSVPNKNTSANDQNTHKKHSLLSRIKTEFFEMLLGFGPWIIVSVILASIANLYITPEHLSNFTGAKNLFSPFFFSISALPFYFCAGSDIPISKMLLEKGIGLGSILSFMAGAPAINITSFLLYQKWLGVRNSVIYLAISFLVCGILGIIINAML